MKKVSKSDVEKQIKEFFCNIKNKTPKEIKKIKRLAMNKNISLKGLRKKFCKKCFTPYKNPKVRIKGHIKKVICENCKYSSRWKLKL